MLKTVTVYKSVVIPGGDGVGTVVGVGIATYCRKDNKERKSVKDCLVAFLKKTLTLNFTPHVGQRGSAQPEQVAMQLSFCKGTEAAHCTSSAGLGTICVIYRE